MNNLLLLMQWHTPGSSPHTQDDPDLINHNDHELLTSTLGLSSSNHIQRIMPNKWEAQPLDPRYEGILSKLLEQPLEIIVGVFMHLFNADLMSLRLVNRKLHELTHYAAETIGVTIADFINTSWHLQHCPVAVPDLESLVLTTKKFRSFFSTAAVIAQRVSSNLRSHTIQYEPEALKGWQAKKGRLIAYRLIRSFILLDRYLQFMRNTFDANEADLQPLNDDEFTTLTNIFDLDQQMFMSNCMGELTENDYIDVTATLSILKSICKARHVPFTQQANVQPFMSVQALLVYTGFLTFPSLIKKGVARRQQREILRTQGEDFVKRRRRSFHVTSNTKVTHLSGYIAAMQTSSQLDDRRDRRIKDTFVQNQDLWDRAARWLMMQKLGRCPFEQSVTTWIRRVCAVAGEDREADIVIGPWDHPDPR